MNYGAMKDEFAARGFDYLSDARRGQYLNFARAMLDSSAPWSYRKRTGTGTSGFTVTPATDNALGIGVVYLVQDTDNQYATLRPASEEDLAGVYGDLTLAGTPFAYYVTRTGTSATVSVYPVGGAIRVSYYGTPFDLSGPTDTPLSPPEYHGLIVDMAVQMAYRDSDDAEAAMRLQAWIDTQQQRMVEDLFADQPPTLQALTFSSSDW
jgi:hypothetical protein